MDKKRAEEILDRFLDNEHVHDRWWDFLDYATEDYAELSPAEDKFLVLSDVLKAAYTPAPEPQVKMHDEAKYVLIEYEDIQAYDDEHYGIVIDVDLYDTVEQAIAAAELRAVEAYFKYVEKPVTWMEHTHVWKGGVFSQASVKIPVIERGYSDISCEFEDRGQGHQMLDNQPKKFVTSVKFSYARWMLFEESIPVYKSDMIFTDRNPEYDLRFDIYQVR